MIGSSIYLNSSKIENKRLRKDKFASRLMLSVTVFSGMIVFLMVYGLYLKSKPILVNIPLGELIFSTSWHPFKGEFGFFPYIMGTIWVTMVAVVIAVPLSLLTAIFLSEYAHKRVMSLVNPLIDLLAGIPSIVYGVWALLIIVPLISVHIAPLFGIFSTGYCVLSAGLVLAVMILPIIIHVSVEVFNTMPHELREASLSLGATKWQTIKHVVIRKSMPGIIAAIVLGISRAFGETMAVLMVAGNVAQVPSSVFDPAYPLPALIANNYGEMLSIPLYDSALMLASLILLIIVLFFNIISRVILIKVERSIQ
jgi:phosphate transport system permease protein